MRNDGPFIAVVNRQLSALVNVHFHEYQACEELGVEVGGFLRHAFAA